MLKHADFRPTGRLTLCAAALLISSHACLLHAEVPKDPVDVSLTEVELVRRGSEIRLDCSVVLTNNTGKDLIVKSHGSSAFDGFKLVVFNSEGTRLLHQGWPLFVSPFATAQSYRLKKGINRDGHVFVFSDAKFPKVTKGLRVILVGTLPGTDHPGPHCSNMRLVSLKKTATPERE